MRDVLKKLTASVTALRLLVAELRELNADVDFTSIAVDSWGMLKIQVRTDDEAAPFLAVMSDAVWTSTEDRAVEDWYHVARRGSWAGIRVELVVCHKLPEPDVTVDPTDCGCTDCLTGQSVPVSHLTDDHLAAIRAGRVLDRSGGDLQRRLDAEGGEPRG